ncbi:hypothetical protein BGZ95_011962 [Linnemannia exigua]|uniref:Uncharacterized protein n=1 Tax=Linnemannia exigua TaxID=604196 RepID=A0AAD4D9N1_9FUNG|nr:hypothetical protein BGZ95_011962 [Linnemannia exigua]
MASGAYAAGRKDYLYGVAVRRDIERQLGWALCLPESVQDLTISVMDCQRYLDNAKQSKALKHIRFTFEDQFEHNHFDSDGTTHTTHGETTAREQEMHKKRVGRDDLFLWAVKEKQEYDHQRDSRQIPANALVLIESARFQYDEPHYGSQIGSFIQAFGSNLGSSTIKRQFVFNTLEDPVEEPVVCGRQWSLPKLDHLPMVTYLAPLTLEPDSLADCLVLQNLFLDDSLNGIQVTTSTPSWKAVILPA